MRADVIAAMRVRQLRLIAFVVAAICLPSVGSAQTSEDDQKQACMGDAFRFCTTSIPDRQAVGRCLVSNRDQLTPACRNMIDSGRAARAKKG